MPFPGIFHAIKRTGSSFVSIKVNDWKITVGQGLKVPYPDIYTLKPSGLASVKVYNREVDVGQGLKVPSPDIFRTKTYQVVVWPRSK